MNDNELRELENPDNWDFERPEHHPASKTNRAVVSVAFAREDFDRVSAAAEMQGKRTSAFIREAALERASNQAPRRIVHLSVTGTLGTSFYFWKEQSKTDVSGPAADVPQNQDAVTA